MSQQPTWQHLRGTSSLLAIVLAFASTVNAHEHHMDKIEPGQGASADPIDTILWIHIFLQIGAWGLLFPTGMVLGIIRSRWHVPVQIFATAIAILAYFLGHLHKGRQFAENVHSSYAPLLMLFLAVQVVLGLYLKLHLERGIHGRIRRVAVIAHGVVGKALPVAAWVQMLFGGITALGFCRDDHLGQCIAHFIMGSAFIAYGILLTILLLVGQLWLRRTGRSQEFFDSLIIAAWGCVNTFTEHRWGGPWVHNDLQHTTMGIIWWCAGLVGVWLSRKRDGGAQRNVIPGFVLILTGWAMSSHPQNLPLSTMVHTVFGYTLMAAGATRIIEISFVLRDRDGMTEDASDTSSFQYVPVFLLYASGFLFMGATEEQMDLLSSYNVTHVTYVLILYSIAFLLFLFVLMLLNLYSAHAAPVSKKPIALANGHLNGSLNGGLNGGLNGHARGPGERGAGMTGLRDAEEFELEGLMSDDEDEEEGRGRGNEEAKARGEAGV
ncbi:integral membrane protein-like protein [Aulographum hederae CBS 113979]|uniref:Integral membrane protein-like protein n=1 Tax=Aulographum hederae CBS 113979 TaxID=1176131 RepID=A0A6G1GRP5_9PEZI|nr:integral membrane protein-like protein [Aulographum hederae CBS 113979]